MLVVGMAGMRARSVSPIQRKLAGRSLMVPQRSEDPSPSVPTAAATARGGSPKRSGELRRASASSGEL
eukprot:15465466-Alexandrium_andersonii.AAC.1